MFIKLLHGLQLILNKFIQKWTKQDIQNIEDSIVTKHDFDDGLGEVKAIPLDEVESNLILKNMTVATSPNDIIKPETKIDTMIVSKIPNDYIMPNTKINNMIVSTTPNDYIMPTTEMHNMIVSKNPNDYVFPIAEIHNLIVATNPNDKLNASLSLIEFNIEQG